LAKLRYLDLKAWLRRGLFVIAIFLGRRDYTMYSTDQFLHRAFGGYDAAMTPAEIYDATRGWWRLDGDRAKREHYALAVGDGYGVQTIEIADWRYASTIGRWAFAGTFLGPGPPLQERGVGSPVPRPSRNPIHYLPDATGSPCRCGCGQVVRGTWVHGHDQRAIHERIGRDFGGEIASFIGWYDTPEAVAIRPTGSESLN
jgi:hypothetical protein